MNKNKQNRRCPDCHFTGGHAPMCPTMLGARVGTPGETYPERRKRMIQEQEILDALDWETPEWGKLDG